MSTLCFPVLVVTGSHGCFELYECLVGASGQVARSVSSAGLYPLLSTLSGLCHLFQPSPANGDTDEKESEEN